MGTKHCNACGTTKPVKEFGKDRWGSTGYTDYCKKCRNERARARNNACVGYYKRRHEENRDYKRAYYRRPDVLDRLRDGWFKKKYGMSIKTYYKLLKDQDSKCAICRADAGESKTMRLAVDHCHTTNVVRGLLCCKCNRALGLFGDDLSILLKAVDYMKRNILKEVL